MESLQAPGVDDAPCTDVAARDCRGVALSFGMGVGVMHRLGHSVGSKSTAQFAGVQIWARKGLYQGLYYSLSEIGG